MFSVEIVTICSNEDFCLMNCLELTWTYDYAINQSIKTFFSAITITHLVVGFVVENQLIMFYAFQLRTTFFMSRLNVQLCFLIWEKTMEDPLFLSGWCSPSTPPPTPQSRRSLCRLFVPPFLSTPSANSDFAQKPWIIAETWASSILRG